MHVHKQHKPWFGQEVKLKRLHFPSASPLTCPSRREEIFPYLLPLECRLAVTIAEFKTVNNEVVGFEPTVISGLFLLPDILADTSDWLSCAVVHMVIDQTIMHILGEEGGQSLLIRDWQPIPLLMHTWTSWESQMSCGCKHSNTRIHRGELKQWPCSVLTWCEPGSDKRSAGYPGVKLPST